MHGKQEAHETIKFSKIKAYTVNFVLAGGK